jgi:hypothetical protein
MLQQTLERYSSAADSRQQTASFDFSFQPLLSKILLNVSILPSLCPIVKCHGKESIAQVSSPVEKTCFTVFYAPSG